MTIEIKKQEPVSTTGGKPMVTGPSLNFAEGWSRKQAIEAARQEVLEEMKVREEAALPWNQEIVKLSGAIADLQQRVKELENAQTKSK